MQPCKPTRIMQLIRSIRAYLARLPHSRPKPLRVPAAIVEDNDATVVTSNTSSSDSSSNWTTVGICEPLWAHSSAAAPLRSPRRAVNYYAPLDDEEEEMEFDATSIAVDSGASDNFGDLNTPGTGRTPVINPVTMASATGDCKKSITKDAFDLPLPWDPSGVH